MIWRSSHWKLLPRGISHIPARFRIWLHLTNTLTFHAANVIRTATEATTKTTLWVNIGSPTSHVNWSLCVCYCWSDCFSTSPIQHGTRIKKTRWKKSRQVKGHLAYIRPLHHNAFNWPIIPPFQTPFAPTEHVHRPLTRVPFSKSTWWHRGFYTSRDMTGHVCFSFRLSGIIILAFIRSKNTK